MVYAIDQDGPGYKTKCLAWGTLQTRQKTAHTAHTAQTQHHPQCQKKLRFTTPEASSEELAQELPFSEAYAPKPWDTPSLAFKRKIRKKAAAVAKKKGKSLAKKALEWKTWKTP